MKRIHQICIISLLSITALAFAQVSVNPMSASPNISSSPMPNPSKVQGGVSAPSASPVSNNDSAMVNSNTTENPVSSPLPMNTPNIESPTNAPKNSKPYNPNNIVKTNSLDNGLNATQGMPSNP